MITNLFLTACFTIMSFGSVYLCHEMFWFIYGLICQILGGPSNDLLSSVSHNFVSTYIDDIRPRVSSYAVLDGRITDIRQIYSAQDALNKVIIEIEDHSFRQRHFDKRWISYFQKEINEAKAALKYQMNQMNKQISNK